jgi:hypothetical protein
VFNCEPKIVIAENFNEIEQEFLTNGTIYFMETHNSIDHQITAREACAIESAGMQIFEIQCVIKKLVSMCMFAFLADFLMSHKRITIVNVK